VGPVVVEPETQQPELDLREQQILVVAVVQAEMVKMEEMVVLELLF